MSAAGGQESQITKIRERALRALDHLVLRAAQLRSRPKNRATNVRFRIWIFYLRYEYDDVRRPGSIVHARPPPLSPLSLSAHAVIQAQ